MAADAASPAEGEGEGTEAVEKASFEYIPGPSYHALLDEDSRPHDNLHCDDARCYDPSTGRWLSQAPLGFKAGETNLYRHCIPAKGRFLPEE